MKRTQWLIATAFILAFAPWQVQADVRLSDIFKDNMMIQRDQPVAVWGWAASGESVTVTLAGKEASATADEKGRWSIKLAALKSGENLELKVSGKNSITLTNLIVGDIWLCAGQSNMQMGLGECWYIADDIKNADLPQIRRIRINWGKSDKPQDDVSVASPWQVCTPQTAGGFSAVGFYFAREIAQKTGVPIGILDAGWNGTAIEPWTSPEGMEMVPELRQAVADVKNGTSFYPTDQMARALDETERWIATARKTLAKGELITSSPTNIPWHPDFSDDRSIFMGAVTGGRSSWNCIFNATIRPLGKFPIKGALWYQGETNGNEDESYYDKMRALVSGWRKLWSIGDFPFYFVQLARYQGVNEDPAGGDGWARVRCAQTKSLKIPHTGMAVTIDTDADLHPKNKYDVGLRLSRWALVNDYGQKNMEVSGPLFREMKVEGGKIRLKFDHTGAGLMVGKKKDGREPVAEDKDGKLKRFSIAGADKKWFWADAVIDGATVVVSSPDVKAPVAVRYAFSQNPDGANLYNKDGLPASPFRTDSW